MFDDFKYWFDGFWSEWGVFVVVLLVIIVIIGGVVAGGVYSSHKTCLVYGDMGIPVQWNFWTGCMANHPKFGWIPVDQYFKVLNLNTP